MLARGTAVKYGIANPATTVFPGVDSFKPPPSAMTTFDDTSVDTAGTGRTMAPGESEPPGKSTGRAKWDKTHFGTLKGYCDNKTLTYWLVLFPDGSKIEGAGWVTNIAQSDVNAQPNTRIWIEFEVSWRDNPTYTPAP